MRLKYLEIAGFKSFARKAFLEFSVPVSAIVGPNGSGKSNVAEAIRFVLGEQSLKSLRGKKGEDLVFNGTKHIARQNRAKVSVAFDNADRVFPLDYDEVILSREVHRDSSNRYFINGTQARLKDIFELLASVNIGASGHHIISQGEADRILSSSIKERKTMVEDALGLKIYHYKIEESRRRLEKTEENINEVESRESELAPRIKFLRSQMKKIEEMRAVRTDLAGLYREYLARERAYLDRERRAITDEEGMARTLAGSLSIEIAEKERALGTSGNIGRSAKEEELDRTLIRIRSEKGELLRQLGRMEGVLEYAAARAREEAPRAPAAVQRGKDIPHEDAERFFSATLAQLAEAIASPDFGRVREILVALKKALESFVGSFGNLPADEKQEGEHVKEEPKGANMNELRAQKEALSAETERKLREEEETLAELAHARTEREHTLAAGREAERELFDLRGKERDVTARLSLLESRRRGISAEEELFTEELAEGGALVGRAIFEYESYAMPPDTESEDRARQQERRRKIEKLKIRLEDGGGASERDIEKEFREVSERQEFFARELADLRASKESLLSVIGELEGKLAEEFAAGIKNINARFTEFFSLMFGGGEADIRLVREEKRARVLDSVAGEDVPALPEEQREYTEGLDIRVELPRKKIRGLAMLSGGERALVSIALLFALSQVNPPPFLVLDETDAALDEANSRKYGDMLENLSKVSQLIVITHNRETMGRAGVLYGVTMDADSSSQIFSVKFDEAKAYAK